MRKEAVPMISDSTQYIGDRRKGCACIYRHFSPKSSTRRDKQLQVVGKLSNVDVFVSSVGTKTNRFFCHRDLTTSYPKLINSPPEYEPKSFYNAARHVGTAASQAFWSVCRFLFPKFQFGVGINLWQFRGQ